MVVAALLSAIHMLTLALGAGAVFARGRALEHPLDDEGWKRLLAAVRRHPRRRPLAEEAA